MEIQDIQMMMITLIRSGLNEYEIANQLKVSQPTVSRWLSGRIKTLKMQNFFALHDLYQSTRLQISA